MNHALTAPLIPEHLPPCRFVALPPAFKEYQNQGAQT